TKELLSLRQALEASAREKPVCSVPKEDQKRSVWVEPSLVIEARFTAISADLRLRQPIFVRVRDDKTVDDIERVGESKPPAAEEAPAVAISNPSKVFFPELGLTKKDLVDYYRAIAPWLLPYLADRPLVLTRYPDGIDGK